MTLLNKVKNESIRKKAKRFKRWVTEDVLPSIRKTGTYQVPDNPMDALKLMFDAQKQTKEEIATVKADVIDIKENQKLDAGEYGLITKNSSSTRCLYQTNSRTT